MTPDRWQHIDDLFHRALEREPAERAAFLAQACASDEILFREVASLLAAHEQAGSFYENAPAELATEVLGDDQAQLRVGQTLGHFKILELIGAGGMGEVYLAQDTKLDRRVALKMLLADVASDQQRMRRFLQEAKAASALNHPNVCVIYEVGETDEGRPFMAVEYVEGQTLDAKMREHPLDVVETITIARQIADALAEAHSKGIIHRDIKPSNIMITVRGQVKVLDFGLAKVIHRGGESPASEASTPAKTEPGVLMGTVRYMSPEQARGRDVDHRTDIFSLGIVLYEVIAGRAPFEGETASDVLAAILKTEPVPLAECAPTHSTELQRIVRTCLEKDRERRYGSAEELLLDLTNLKRGLELGASAPVVESQEQRRRLLLSQRWLALSALAVLAVAALSFLLLVRPWPTILSGPREPSYSGTPAAISPEIKSLAVLPLENLSGDPAQEYFADGMTEALIGNLARIRALKVISRTSVMRYKGSRKSLPEIARELNVDAVIEGSVQRSGERVRVTAQLIHAATDAHVWARDYERDLTDVLKLQGEVARAIANEIQIQVTAEERARLASARSVNPQAHEAYLLGRYHLSKNNSQDWEQAIEHFKWAIGFAPDYAPAYAGLSEALLEQAVFAVNPSKENVPPARTAALKAIELDEQLAEAHTALGNVKYYYDWDWAGAEKEFERALELNPASLIVHIAYGRLLSSLGRHDEAVREGQIAVQLDPLSAEAHTALGRFLYRARRYEEALPVFQRAVQLEPRSIGANTRLGSVYAALGRYTEALAGYEKAIEAAPSVEGYRDVIAYVYARMGRKKEARQMVSGMRDFPIDVAGVYAALGDKDKAFRVLEEAIEERKQQLIVLKEDPTLENLHSDPRWKALLRRMNFPGE